MTTHRKIEWMIFLLGIGGTLFSGYLSAVKFFTDTCAFGKACPYFLGYPSCYFGFAMFALITLFAGLHVAHIMDGREANKVVLAIGVCGTAFAGYFTALEVPLLLKNGLVAYIVGLPTCALGLLFFIAVTVLAYKLRKDF